MNKPDVKKKVFECWAKGHCCSESIAISILDAFGSPLGAQACRAASGFRGGTGKTHLDICGALSGGIIALGFLMGRESGGDNAETLYQKTAEFRSRFMQRFGSTCCETLLEKKGDDPNYCRDLTAEAASILYEIIRE